MVPSCKVDPVLFALLAEPFYGGPGYGLRPLGLRIPNESIFLKTNKLNPLIYTFVNHLFDPIEASELVTKQIAALNDSTFIFHNTPPFLFYSFILA